MTKRQQELLAKLKKQEQEERLEAERERRKMNDWCKRRYGMNLSELDKMVEKHKNQTQPAADTPRFVQENRASYGTNYAHEFTRGQASPGGV